MPYRAAYPAELRFHGFLYAYGDYILGMSGLLRCDAIAPYYVRAYSYIASLCVVHSDFLFFEKSFATLPPYPVTSSISRSTPAISLCLFAKLQ